MTEVPKSDLTKFGKLGWMEQREQVVLRCPNGHVNDLGDHNIAISGAVEPSVVCPKCGWHDNVRLMDYSAVL